MRLSHLLIASLALAAPVFAGSSSAGSPGDARLGADLARAERQQTRLDTGIATGSINAREAAANNRRLGRIDNGIERLSADGRYSRRDAFRIDQRQDNASRQLARTRGNRR